MSSDQSESSLLCVRRGLAGTRSAATVGKQSFVGLEQTITSTLKLPYAWIALCCVTIGGKRKGIN